MLARTDWPEDYLELFWDLYPRRVAKKAAARALDKVRKAREVPFEVLIAAVKIYASAVRGKDMQYIAHPATWLNAGRWDDDPRALCGAERRTAGDNLLAGLASIAADLAGDDPAPEQPATSIPRGRFEIDG